MLRFYLTPPGPCPYLPGREERKVFTPLIGEMSTDLNGMLSQLGFRRSQSIAYRPACEGCSACISVRIRVDDFTPSRSMRRVRNRNATIHRDVVRPVTTSEQYSLFSRYLNTRHAGGGMSEMDMHDFAGMVEDTAVDTVIVEYRKPVEEGRMLRAFCLIDRLEDGLSMVYSVFEPDAASEGPGVYMVLDQIDFALELGLPYVYLGYWIAGCQKMEYKRRFKPLEALTPDGWMPIEDASEQILSQGHGY